MSRPIITLTTDWGMRDYYVGSVKGRLLSKLPEATIVDISHYIAPHDMIHASFVLRNAFPQFPDNTIHLIGIGNNATLEQPHTIVKAHNQYFIGTDTGIFSLLINEVPEKIIHIEMMQESDYFTFPTRDIFCKAAAHIAQGKELEELGIATTTLNKSQTFFPSVGINTINAKVIHIDRYQNLITNLSKDTFLKARKRRDFTIHFMDRQFQIHEIHKQYNDVGEADLIAIFGTSGFLEIAMNRGNAKDLLGMKLDSAVIMEFHNT